MNTEGKDSELGPKLSKKEIKRFEKEQKMLAKLRKQDPFYLGGGEVTVLSTIT